MGRGYNIKFNKTLFRKAVFDEWKAAAISLVILGPVAAFATIAFWSWQWPIWVPVIAWVMFLWFVVSSLFMAVVDTVEYRRIYVRGDKTEG